METGRGVRTTCSTRHWSTTRPVHPHSQRYRSSGINRDNNNNYVAMETGRGAGRLVVHGARPQHV